MNSALLAMPVAIIQYSDGTTDFSGKEGYLCKNTAGVIAINDSATVPAPLVCLDGQGINKPSSFGVIGALGGPIRLAATGTIGQYSNVQQQNDGTVITDAGAGARVVLGVALESCITGEMPIVATFAAQIRS